ncbi:MAG TPA: Uma2 family endonuclease [Pirellulales bacterium]|nr:Uma2 family endonuclease [Pirellulales bacterium]
MKSISSPPLPGTTCDPLYPDSDGEPMGETEYHMVAAWHLFYALKCWYRQRKRSDVYVAGTMLLYYEEGNPLAFRGPDVMVCKGVVGNHPRRSFRTWEEGVVPAVIFEVVSKKTLKEDRVEKPPMYASLGVKELFLFDPEGGYLRPSLQGFKLVRRRYVPLATDDRGDLFSTELGMSLKIEGHLLRLTDRDTGERLPTDEELAEQASLARQQAKRAKRDAQQAKRRAAELEAELARLRASSQRRKNGK